ncbi:hypothetical protein ABB37_03936 [Leptomonas pyrrhocoris]|uniref:Uncharacterized protein n=1 Tax=Leptomonas pyrrhocoris TaxID=157538 RepID=A0A0N1J4X8_LEPPY|nr:hypothetical protein ABB37_03936 [Leptomonas pyrrhocoris]KPA81602.1 hypothetical protein ABB37_03936 [Leptomonas pyrrhocoris]|eukprot:XP_015660041.1 hypothetical protein ABB37_03936 [Leptomonas pyrrhocoris]
MDSTRPFLDVPITAVRCAPDGAVYFAAGNVVYRSSPRHRTTAAASLASSFAGLPTDATERCICAPPSTVITTLALAACSLHPPHELITTALHQHLTLVLIGAADRLLAQIDSVALDQSGTGIFSSSTTAAASSNCSVAQPTSCACVLQTAESRILCIAVDAARGLVLALTASNDVFYVRLSDVERALQTGIPSQYRDVSQRLRHGRVRGPPLGVVLAADILIENETSDDASLPSYRLFAATYAGEVVEWYPTQNTAEMIDAMEGSPEGQRSGQADEFCIAARVQAHPSGCAIFSVRVAQSFPSMAEGAGRQRREPRLTHLATCSDDRTVALYECRRPVANDAAGERGTSSPSWPHEQPHPEKEEGWVLLWRGSGTSFSKTRVFDVAVCAVWSSARVPASELSSSFDSSTARWSCGVHVAAAGEDGCVQALRIEKQRGEGDAIRQSNSVKVSCCFVRPRQHRGHGAYRVAFCTPTVAQMTLLSGGFDGTVFAHSYLAEAAVEARAPCGARVFDTSTVAMPLPPSITHRVSPFHHRPAPSKAAQVRVVHVDAAGCLLAFTNHLLCVQCHDGALEQDWSIPLPTSVNPDASWGLPTCAESFPLPLASREHKMASDGEGVADASCVMVGTTTGTLYVIPYVYSRGAGRTVRWMRRPMADASQMELKTSTSPSTTALQIHGKITHMEVVGLDDNTASTADARQRVVLVATNHVRHTVALSAVHVRFSNTAGVEETPDGNSLQLEGEWRFQSLFENCPGPLTTALSLISTASVAGTATHSFWLLVGDKNGCLVGVEELISAAELCSTSSKVALPVSVPITKSAAVYAYVFPAHLHIAISAFCVEGAVSAVADKTSNADKELSCEPVVLRIAGTGGVVEFLRLPATTAEIKALHCGDEGTTPTLRAARSREPLRLPFEISSFLAVSRRVCVVQSGTTVSVLYRIPGRTAWVLVDAYADIRAPRLLTARICEGGQSIKDQSAGTPMVFLAHCSDGHTVEQFVCCPDQLQLQSTSERCVRTSVLHGGGLPGKDYNCITYAPAPLHCLLMGNEDSSLVVVPLHAPPTHKGVPSLTPWLLRRFTAPMNIGGAHHSNILAIAVLPRTSTDSTNGRLRFASVGGGAMVNLWSSDNTSNPLRLVDWWCGSTPKTASPPLETKERRSLKELERGVRGTSNGSSTSVRRITSSANFHKTRVKQAQAPSASVALTERISRFMCAAAWDTHTFAVGSSDGTMLFFRVQPTETDSMENGTTSTSYETLQLEWQGPLNEERSKPIFCVTSTVIETGVVQDSEHAEKSGLLVAGDTNGVVYVVSTVTHRVVTQLRLEQSSVNALSEIHAVSVDSMAAEAAGKTHRTWRFAAVHDSGVVHLTQIEATFSPDTSLPHNTISHAQLTVLSSASTGVTAGRGVCWTLASQPLVVVTEERITQFDPRELQRGVLAVLCERRVNVRCVSGAAVVPEIGLCASTDETEGATLQSESGSSAKGCLLPRVAVAGQGFEM